MQLLFFCYKTTNLLQNHIGYLLFFNKNRAPVDWIEFSNERICLMGYTLFLFLLPIYLIQLLCPCLYGETLFKLHFLKLGVIYSSIKLLNGPKEAICTQIDILPLFIVRKLVSALAFSLFYISVSCKIYSNIITTNFCQKITFDIVVILHNLYSVEHFHYLAHLNLFSLAIKTKF